MKDIYKTYSIEALATDPDFIDWAKGKPNIDRDAWDDWLNKNPNSTQKFQEARKFIQAMSFQNIDTQEAAGRIWQRIEESTDGALKLSKDKNTIVRPYRGLILAIAAALALLLIFQFLLGTDTAITTLAGEDQLYTLPDMSTVHLNDGSSLLYDEKKYASNRSLVLQGEAFFEVARGATFVVETQNGSVQVLGTSFNVFSRESEFEVKCFTGKVRVQIGSREVLLSPGQMYHSGKASGNEKPEEFEVSNHRDWRQGFFRFQDVSLRQVMEEIKRQFDVDVILDEGLPDIKYTGFFTEEALEEALYSVCWPLKLDWDVKEGVVRIGSNL